MRGDGRKAPRGIHDNLATPRCGSAGVESLRPPIRGALRSHPKSRGAFIVPFSARIFNVSCSVRFSPFSADGHWRRWRASARPMVGNAGACVYTRLTNASGVGDVSACHACPPRESCASLTSWKSFHNTRSASGGGGPMPLKRSTPGKCVTPPFGPQGGAYYRPL